MDYCNHCWTRFATGQLTYKYCPLPECEGEVVPIDDDMATTILLLNDKGYMTRNCCSGHVGDSCPSTYIQFFNQIEFATTPKGFTVEVRELSPHLTVTNICKQHNRKTDPVKLQKSIWKACADLLDWAEKLPVNEECY